MRFHRVRTDLGAFLVGIATAVLALYAALGYHWLTSWGECHGEDTPYLGSAPQAHVTPYCLAKDEGPFIGLKKRLGIYDPNWKIVVK